MCCNSNCACRGGKCTTSKIAKVLLIVGGLNWGLVGAGMLANMADWNVVHMVLGSMPTIEAIVYVLVGVAAIMKIFHCKCKKCAGGVCSVDGHMGDKMSGDMAGKM